ncbi:MAG: 6-pyruvoyl tetrahydropterin synthase family protein [Phycisphaerae bacterium]|nr:6-pyruvoyl tetrahydropterin synthase family protein [Phycisphaerae bacterium]
MFRITVSRTFDATHALLIGGVREPVHGHQWRVEVTLSGPDLDRDGLLLDFHDVECALGQILSPFDGGNLNSVPPFHQVNPSAEEVARHVARSLTERLGLGARTEPSATRPVRVTHVRVSEAPGCLATFEPEIGTPVNAAGGSHA